MTAKITVTQGATLGSRDIRVTTLTGSSFLVDAITIEEASSQGLAPWAWALVGLAVVFMAGGIAACLVRRRLARLSPGLAYPTERVMGPVSGEPKPIEPGTGPMAAEPKTTEVQAGGPSSVEVIRAKQDRTRKKKTRKKKLQQ